MGTAVGRGIRYFICLVVASGASAAFAQGSEVGAAGGSPYGPFRTVRAERAAPSGRPARACEPFERLEREKSQARRISLPNREMSGELISTGMSAERGRKRIYRVGLRCIGKGIMLPTVSDM